MEAPLKFPLTIFYDASCPMCANEMHALKARDTRQYLALVDCSSPEYRNEFAECEGIKREAMLGLLHARDANGRWLVGVECLPMAYRAAGLYKFAWLLESRLLRPFLLKGYPWLAKNRQFLSQLGMNTLVHLLLPRSRE